MSRKICTDEKYFVTENIFSLRLWRGHIREPCVRPNQWSVQVWHHWCPSRDHAPPPHVSLTLSVSRCKAQYGGRTCDECNNGYYLYPQCVCKYRLFFTNMALRTLTWDCFEPSEQVLLMSMIRRCQGHHTSHHHMIWTLEIVKDGHHSGHCFLSNSKKQWEIFTVSSQARQQKMLAQS